MIVRQLAVPSYNDLTEVSPSCNQRGEGVVIQGLPPKAELVRLGLGWSTAVPIANAFAPVAASPTTLANIIVYNGSTTKCLIIDTVWAYCQTSIAAASSFMLLGQIAPPNIAAPTDNTACKIRSRVGKAYSGATTKAIANSAFAVAEFWEGLGACAASPAASIGAGAFADVFGGFIVPPLQAFCANLVASTAGGTMVQGVSWFEITLPVNV